jgi:hypothetical protein
MILANEIFANGPTADALGIDLLDNGVSANGSEDPAVLPPFPVLTNADAVAAGTAVGGTIDYPIGHAVRVEFFSSPTCDDSGHGEGQTPLGALTVTGSGVPAAFGARVATAPAGHAITATATDLDVHRTSEFSRCARQSGAPPTAGDPPPDKPDGGDPPGPKTDAADGANGLPPVIDPPPPVPPCEVPKLAGLTVAQARKRLVSAGCGVRKLKTPKRPRGGRYRLVVKRASHRPGTIHAAGTRVGLTLVWKRVKRRT